jgi:hypothetical protein
VESPITPQANAAITLPSQAAPAATLADMFVTLESTSDSFNLFANSVIDPDTGKSMEYRELITNPKTKLKWTHSSANEFGRLAQGVDGRIKGTNTIKSIRKANVPTNKIVTYALFVCVLRPQKAETERTCWTERKYRLRIKSEMSRTSQIEGKRP